MSDAVKANAKSNKRGKSLKLNEILDILDDDDFEIEQSEIKVSMMPPDECDMQDSASDSDDSDSPLGNIGKVSKKLLDGKAECNFDPESSSDDNLEVTLDENANDMIPSLTPPPGSPMSEPEIFSFPAASVRASVNEIRSGGKAINTRRSKRKKSNEKQDITPSLTPRILQAKKSRGLSSCSQPDESVRLEPSSVPSCSTTVSTPAIRKSLRNQRSITLDESSFAAGDTSFNHSDDDQNISDQDLDCEPLQPVRQHGKNKNPEYNRHWYPSDQGVGGSLDNFNPAANLSQSDLVQSLKSPYEVFRLFIPDEFIDLAVYESKQYGMQKGYANKAAMVTSDTFLCSIGVILLSGYSRLPSKKMYWQCCPDTFSPLVSDNIRRDVFEAVLYCTHFTNNAIVDNDRFRKVRPLFDNLNKTAKQFLPITEHRSIDEMMIPYFGHHSDKQFIRGKPIRYGFKVWALCDVKGFSVHLEPYCGKFTDLPDYGMGQGPNVVAGLVEKGEVCGGTKLYFDNLFSSMPLLDWLSSRGIGGTGTMRMNRVAAIPLPEKKEVERQFQRGESKSVYTGDAVVCVWKDNKPVYCVSNVHPAKDSSQVPRWSREGKKEISIKQPGLIKEYNSNMGGVDLLDQMVSVYRSKIRKRKWWWCFWPWSLSVAAVNAWRLYQLTTNDKAMPYLTFLRQVVMEMMKRHGVAKSRTGPPIQLYGPAKEAIRLDRKDHWIILSDIKGVCGQCHKR